MGARSLTARPWGAGTAALCWFILLVASGSPGCFAQDLLPIPNLAARVNDVTGTLTAEQQAQLEEKLSAFEARKGAQLALLVVPTTGGEPIENYSYRVILKWLLGRKGVNDGVLLIIAKDDREMRIEVGKGLEGALTDATCNRIISEAIVPLFRQGDFFGGISAGLDRIIAVIDGEPLPAPDLKWRGQSERGVAHWVPFLFFAVLFGSMVLRSLLGRGLGALVAGAVTGIVVYVVGQVLFTAIVGGLIAFLFALISGFSGGGSWSSYPRNGGWGGGLGGFGGGGFGGGGGSGGFSGGGGGFNGGGASGRW
jgi:uncharacterized protein